MLTELLDTRVMVKHAMKSAKDDKVVLFRSHFVHILKYVSSQGPEESLGRTTIGSEVHCECNLRVHKRFLLWPNASR